MKDNTKRRIIMKEIIIFEIITIVALIIVIYCSLTKWKNENTNIKRYGILSVLKRTILIYLSSIIFGSLIIYYLFSQNSYSNNELETSKKITDFLLLWGIYCFYSMIYSIIPAFLILFPGLYLILNSKIKPSKKIWLNLTLCLLASGIVLIVNIFHFTNSDLFWLEFPYIFAGIVSCILIPKWFKDYKE